MPGYGHLTNPCSYSTRTCLLLHVTLCSIIQAAPFYRIFVADARAPRDGKHIDVVGHFDPIPGIACGRSNQSISHLGMYHNHRLILQAKMATSTSL